ncbi:hypothetical protein L9F63_017375 [Diploptera punctata]|uniref:NAD-dependent protein deacylase n=1 Tax=Diploptera punctata TaxID=6984 RepID=A0AAD7ZZB3_DIPPU|nr:hypothetical protein L9F63_017375 [Diploptera punctata]
MLAVQKFVNKNIVVSKLTAMARRSQPSSDMAAFRQVLNKANNVAILSGAGTSAESGIPTFRGAGGFWRTYQAQDLASPRAFARDPSLVWEFYHYRRELVLTKQPNQAHSAIAKFEKHMKDNGKTVTVITQNIDGLHQRAGSENVVELHGSLFKTQCTQCDQVLINRDSPICSALLGAAPDPKSQDARIPEGDLPRFLQQAGDALDSCDICLVIGTSSVVYPAAMFAPQVAERGVPVAEFNIEKTPATFNFQFHFEGPCGSTVPEALSV